MCVFDLARVQRIHTRGCFVTVVTTSLFSLTFSLTAFYIAQNNCIMTFVALPCVLSMCDDAVSYYDFTSLYGQCNFMTHRPNAIMLCYHVSTYAMANLHQSVMMVKGSELIQDCASY